MIDDILKAAARREDIYEINESVSVTLVEMSVKDQFEWSELREKLKDDLPELYVNLIKRCCVELQDAELSDIRKMSASHIIGMGDRIVEISKKKE